MCQDYAASSCSYLRAFRVACLRTRSPWPRCRHPILHTGSRGCHRWLAGVQRGGGFSISSTRRAYDGLRLGEPWSVSRSARNQRRMRSAACVGARPTNNDECDTWDAGPRFGPPIHPPTLDARAPRHPGHPARPTPPRGGGRDIRGERARRPGARQPAHAERGTRQSTSTTSRACGATKSAM